MRFLPAAVQRGPARRGNGARGPLPFSPVTDLPPENSSPRTLPTAGRSLSSCDAGTLAGLAEAYERGGFHRDGPDGHVMAGWSGYVTALRHWGAVRVSLPGEPAHGALAHWAQRGGLRARPDVGDVDLFLRQLRDVRGLKPETANMYLRSVRAVAHRGGRILHDCAVYDALAACRPLPGGNATDRCPPADALVRFRPALRNDAEWAYVRLCCLGVRPPSEHAALTVADWFPGRGAHGVLRVMKRKNRSPVPHWVPVDGETGRALAWTVENRDAVLPKSGHFSPDGGRDRKLALLFPWAATYIGGMVERVRELLGDAAPLYMPRRDEADGAPGCALYALRHLGGTLAAEVSGTLQGTMAVLGDRTETQARVYVASMRGASEAHAPTVAGVMARLDAGGLPAGAAVQGTLPGVRAPRRSAFAQDVAELVREFDAGLLGDVPAPVATGTGEAGGLVRAPAPDAWAAWAAAPAQWSGEKCEAPTVAAVGASVPSESVDGGRSTPKGR